MACHRHDVLSLSVASRRREIAIRAAVGAGRGDIRNLVFADAATLLAVGVLFAGVALLACWRPTHRAARIDPIEALRYE